MQDKLTMSRVGKAPITIPDQVTVTVDGRRVTVKSGSGELSQIIPRELKLEQKGDQLFISPVKNSRQARELHGLTRSLIANAVKGVSAGFSKVLQILGTGYRVAAKDNGLELKLGFSHPIIFPAPEGIKLEANDNNLITVSGADKQLVGETAAKIRRLRPPDVYKGKGIRYQGEEVKLKPGKAAKAAEGGEG